jgi:hypothetical protein
LNQLCDVIYVICNEDFRVEDSAEDTEDSAPEHLEDTEDTETETVPVV